MTIIIVPMASAEHDNVTPITTSFITIDPIGNHTIGDVFIVHGTTNIPVSENLNISLIVYALGYYNSAKYDPNNISTLYHRGYFKELKLTPGTNGINQWSENLTDLDWRPNNKYLIGVFSSNRDVETDEVFTMLPENFNASTDSHSIQQSSSSSSTPILSVPMSVASTQHATPLPIILSINVLVIAIVLHSSINKKGD
ncbi:MAG: hypothetical protein PHF57_02450 [Methanoregula sp.]|nr:hypothetical protein [Methanoregula sp.]